MKLVSYYCIVEELFKSVCATFSSIAFRAVVVAFLFHCCCLPLDVSLHECCVCREEHLTWVCLNIISLPFEQKHHQGATAAANDWKQRHKLLVQVFCCWRALKKQPPKGRHQFDSSISSSTRCLCLFGCFCTMFYSRCGFVPQQPKSVIVFEHLLSRANVCVFVFSCCASKNTENQANKLLCFA